MSLSTVQRPVIQQGVGGTNITTNPKYLVWISDYVAKQSFLRGMCRSACDKMLQVFPELKLVRGWAGGHLSTKDDVLLDPGDGHWWLETESGEIIDPTAGQFLGAVVYVAFDETKASELPTGKCMNCGDYCYGKRKYICSDECEEDYRKACG